MQCIPGNVETVVWLALKRAASECPNSLGSRVMAAAATAFRGYLQQLVINAGRTQVPDIAHELQQAQVRGDMQAGIGIDGKVANHVLNGSNEVRDLLSTKIEAIRGAFRLVSDIISVDGNVSHSQLQARSD